jgi:hypothetical protein
MRIPSNEQRELERTRYWNGQMIRSGDFRGQVATDSQLRWWHNRALHSAYGVALGLEASKYPKDGPLQGVELEPGVAYDCYGRGLILLRQHRVLLPPNPSNPITLLARYRETWDFPDPRQTKGVCLTCCEDSLAQEHPEFIWTAADPPPLTGGVALVRIKNGAGALTIDPKFDVLSSAPLAGPYLATGSTVPGSTQWNPWIAIKAGDQVPLGLQTDVDTSAAGFQQTPCYFAWLEGADELVTAGTIFTHIDYPRPDGFRFRIFLFTSTTADAVLLAVAPPPPTKPPQFYVCWLGCEPQSSIQCLKPEARKTCCS